MKTNRMQLLSLSSVPLRIYTLSVSEMIIEPGDEIGNSPPLLKEVFK